MFTYYNFIEIIKKERGDLIQIKGVNNGKRRKTEKVVYKRYESR